MPSPRDIQDPAGNTLEGPVRIEFFRYFGDSDGDRDADYFDAFRLRDVLRSGAATDASLAIFDRNADGSLGPDDLTAFQLHQLTFLPPLPPGTELDPNISPARNNRGKIEELRGNPSFHTYHLGSSNPGSLRRSEPSKATGPVETAKHPEVPDRSALVDTLAGMNPVKPAAQPSPASDFTRLPDLADLPSRRNPSLPAVAPRSEPARARGLPPERTGAADYGERARNGMPYRPVSPWLASNAIRRDEIHPDSVPVESQVKTISFAFESRSLYSGSEHSPSEFTTRPPSPIHGTFPLAPLARPLPQVLQSTPKPKSNSKTVEARVFTAPAGLHGLPAPDSLLRFSKWIGQTPPQP